MRNKIIFLGLLLVVIIIAYVSLQTENSTKESIKEVPVNYFAALAQYRSQKDSFLRKDKQSPIYEEDRLNFKGLRYFEPDTTFIVKARISKFETSLGIPISMTHGKPEFYKPYGNALFELKGQEYKLMLFRSEADTQLFVAFKDLTSNKESYGGGRYIEIPIKNIKDNTLVIDFNYAFNPFCNYNPTFSCPIPPPENNLDIAILAGEKLFSYLGN